MLSRLRFADGVMIVFLKNSAVLIGTIITMSVILRLYFYPFGIPLTHDAFSYFWYADNTSSLGKLPEGYTFANNGWPVFLASFFAIFKLNSMISYMELQRIITIVISVLTIIPIYFLCKKFTSKYFAVFGAALFAFDPRLIQDSLTGLNNSLYILLVTAALLMFLHPNKNFKYILFGLIGFASLIRSEGLFLFFALSIIYFVHYRKNRNELLRYGILLVIFLLVILPMAMLRIESTGNDALTGRIINEAIHTSSSISASYNGIFTYIANTLSVFFRFLGIVMLPNFIFFVPVGIFLIFRNRNYEKTTIIVTLIITLIPALYAYSFPALDTKYFYPLYPFFCIISVLAMKKFSEFIPKPNFLIVIAVLVIFVLSFIFLNIIIKDLEYEKEYFLVAQYIINNAEGINGYDPEDGFVRALELNEKWPILKSSFSNKITIIDGKEFDSLSDFITYGKNNRLTHIVVDENENRPSFLKDVYLNENKYSYLVKVFDSENLGHKHHVKIFKIDYNLINRIPA